MMAAVTTAAAIDIQGFSRQQHQATGDRESQGGWGVGGIQWGIRCVESRSETQSVQVQCESIANRVQGEFGEY